MRLSDINDDNINAMLRDHATDGGDLINKSLLKLFNLFNDETNKYEVQIKVAALNQLYSTAIQYITPVVSKIVAVYKKIDKPPSFEGYCDLVDKIAAVKWVSLSTGKQHERNNLSFASKYVHFLSQCKTPIFDSYIWIILIGYLNQTDEKKYKFDQPKTYKEFICTFEIFKIKYNMDDYSNYQIDKFLWQYGKTVIDTIKNNEQVSLDQAKSILRRRLTATST